MRLQPAGLTAHVRAGRGGFRSAAVELRIGQLGFEMSCAEALHLADRLVDFAERGITTNDDT